MKCRICDNKINFIFKHKILNKYDVNYYHCNNCGLIQTEEPYWLDEAYSEAIGSMDTGIISRNIDICKYLSLIIPFLIGRNYNNQAFLDYGGGYGLLTRMMRDIGYEFHWKDKFCNNLFARGFEAKDNISYEIVTLFEVLEHLKSPLVEINKILDNKNVKYLIFSTNIYRNAIPNPESWWYYAFEGGQHISFYNINTLNYIARRIGYRLLTNYNNIHVFAKPKKSNFLFKMLIKYSRYLYFLYKIFRIKNKSKTFSDFEFVKRKFKN